MLESPLGNLLVPIVAVAVIALALSVRAGQRGTRGALISIGLITAATTSVLLPTRADSPEGFSVFSTVAAVTIGLVVAASGIVTWRRHRSQP